MEVVVTIIAGIFIFIFVAFIDSLKKGSPSKKPYRIDPYYRQNLLNESEKKIYTELPDKLNNDRYIFPTSQLGRSSYLQKSKQILWQ